MTSRECGQLLPKETFPVIETIPFQDVSLRSAWDTPFREGYPGQGFECSWGEGTWRPSRRCHPESRSSMEKVKLESMFNRNRYQSL